jgi:hypothetical protein
MWSVYNSSGTLVSAGVSYIEPITSTTDRSGGDYTFASGIAANTTYYVVCSVFRTDTNQQIATLTSSNFTTTSSGGGGGEDTTSWYVTRENLGTVDSQSAVINIERPLTISRYQLYCFQVRFSCSGTVYFSTTGSYDTIGYLTTSYDPDLVNGWPNDYESNPWDDDSGTDSNFRIRQNVTAGTTYYLWVRFWSETNSGTTTLHISRSWSFSLGNLNILSTNGEIEIDLALDAPLKARDIRLNFDTAGTAKFYTTGATVAVCGYYSTTDDVDFYNGVPQNITASSTQNGLNFSMSAEVTANNSLANHLCLRAVDGRQTGSVTLHIVPPKGASIVKWDWYSANGDNASASQTISAYNALNGTGTGRNTKNFSHDVWDDMVDKVKEICDEVVGWWDSASYGLSYANTKAIANANGEYVLTADMFNTLRNNLEIAGISEKLGLSKIPTGTSSGQIPHPVNAGDTVFGHYFITLTDYMNSCIDKL